MDHYEVDLDEGAMISEDSVPSSLRPYFTGRYLHLYSAIDETIPYFCKRSKNVDPQDVRYRIIEFGTYDGKRSAALIRAALSLGAPTVQYVGFDLFAEHCTSEIAKKENTASHIPPSKKAVESYFRSKFPDSSKVHILLESGFTKHTAPAFFYDIALLEDCGQSPYYRFPYPVGLIFVDGGHSIPTITNDLFYALCLASPKTVVLLDDYYPDRTDVGARSIYEALLNTPGREHYFHLTLLEPAEYFSNTDTTVQMVRIDPVPNPPRPLACEIQDPSGLFAPVFSEVANAFLEYTDVADSH
jgi:hypothetical protein